MLVSPLALSRVWALKTPAAASHSKLLQKVLGHRVAEAAFPDGVAGVERVDPVAVWVHRRVAGHLRVPAGRRAVDAREVVAPLPGDAVGGMGVADDVILGLARRVAAP